MPKKVKYFTQLGIILLCFIFYGNTLNNGFSLDDHFVIKDNTKVQQGIKGIPAIFTSHYIQTETQNFGYRPITLSSFAIEYEFFGETPSVSHCINVILYILTCLLLFYILSHLFRDYHWLLPILTIGFFLIHPIHSEVVNNIKSRDELLSFLFVLLALWFSIRYARNKGSWNMLISLLFLLISFMAKLSSLTFLAIIPLTLYFFEKISFKKLGFITLGLAIVFVSFNFATSQFLESETREFLFIENPLFSSNSNFFSRIPIAFYTVVYYLKLILYPYPLLFYYGYNHVPIVGWDSLWAWVSILILFPLSVFTLLKLHSKQIWVFGLAYFFVTISMYANLVQPVVGIIAERFAYIPSLGICILLAYGILKVFRLLKANSRPSKKQYIFALSSLFLLTLVSVPYVIHRNTHWKSIYSLVKNDIQYLKNSAKAHEFLGDYYMLKKTKETNPALRKQFIDQALKSYNNTIDIYPKNGMALNNLGVLNQELGNLNKAIPYYLKAHELGINNANSYFNLAMAYYQNKDYQKAISSFEKSIATDSKYIISYDQLMRVHFDNRDLDSAIDVNIRALKEFPERIDHILKAGQEMAELVYGNNSDYYINKLFARGIIDENMYRQLSIQIINNSEL